MRVEIITVTGQVQKFTVQYELLLNDEWRPVVRYDTAHGAIHRDILGLDGQTKTKLRTPIQDLALACDYYIEELVQNWQQYRQRFLRGEHDKL